MPAQTHYHPSVQLHRVRFVDHTPSPITALAFAPIPLSPADVALNSKGKGKQNQHQSEREELGSLVLARENGDLEVWNWARDPAGGVGNWILHNVLPPTLTHPTISHMALVIRDPSNFHTKGYAVPKISDLRVFTAGSDSTEITERCLVTGRILVCCATPLLGLV